MTIRRVLAGAGLLLLLGVSTVAAEQRYDLSALTSAAVKNDPDLHRLEAAAAVDRAGLAGARAALYPTVSFLNTYTAIANPQAPYKLAAGSLGTINLPGYPAISLPKNEVTVVDGGDYDNFNFKFTIDQPLYVWGKIRNNIALNEQLIATDNLKVEQQRDQTTTMVVANLYSLYYLDGIKKLLEEQKKVADDLLGIAKDSLKAGQINDADLIQQRMSVDKVSHAILGVSDQRETALRNLRYLTGMTGLLASQISFAGINTELSARPVPREKELMSEAARRNSDLRMLGLSEQIHQKKVAISQADTPLKPDVGLNLQLGFQGSRIPFVAGNDWETKDLWYANLSLAIKTNIYDGGKAQAAVQGDQATVEETHYKRAAAVQQVEKYISETRYQLGVIRQNIEYYTKRVADTSNLVAYQKHLMEIGTGSKLDYYQKRVDVYTERTQVLQQKLSYATRYFTLMNVIGSAGDINPKAGG